MLETRGAENVDRKLPIISKVVWVDRMTLTPSALVDGHILPMYIVNCEKWLYTVCVVLCNMWLYPKCYPHKWCKFAHGQQTK